MRLKQDRSRKAGHKHALNAQDYGVAPDTDAPLYPKYGRLHAACWQVYCLIWPEDLDPEGKAIPVELQADAAALHRHAKRILRHLATLDSQVYRNPILPDDD